MTEVTRIRKNPEYVANCPMCFSKHWLLRLDGVKDDWKNILGTECVKCGFFVDWVLAEKKQKGLPIRDASCFDSGCEGDGHKPWCDHANHNEQEPNDGR